MFPSYKDGTSRSTPHFSNYPGWSAANRQGRPAYTGRHAAKWSPFLFSSIKLKDLANSRGSYPLTDLVTSHAPIDQSVRYSQAYLTNGISHSIPFLKMGWDKRWVMACFFAFREVNYVMASLNPNFFFFFGFRRQAGQ